MNSPAYYNEFNKEAAAWLRELIAQGHIADGIVDERSIEDVFPNDLRGFAQCHFFAGIGVWSYALRRAGWPDDRSVWTGSCPCQPFSEAGQGTGFDDERHLWPAFFHLIRECKPPRIFGEQVASKDAGPWIDLVHTDMEAVDYAFGAVAFPSAGVGAPHIRDRTYWVANADGKQSRLARGPDGARASGLQSRAHIGGRGASGRLAHCDQGGRDGWTSTGESKARPSTRASIGGYVGGLEYPGHHHDASQGQAARAGQQEADRPADIACGPGVPLLRMANADGERWPGHVGAQPGIPEGQNISVAHGSGPFRPGPTNGFWRDIDWLGCRDGKWRPVEPGTFPLAHGAPARLGRLRGYGNAINAEAARCFIEAVMESAA